MVDYQKRLQLLRQQLDDSIRLYYCQQHTTVNRNNSDGRTVASGAVKGRRILHLLHQNETSACVQILVSSLLEFFFCFLYSKELLLLIGIDS